MNDYQTRKAARIDRLKARAVKAEAEGHAELHKHDALLGVMNGTPILVGHHSQRRHERDFERIHASTRKGIDKLEQARNLASRADAAESNRAISSDDPEALTLLRDKLAKLEASQERGNAINKIFRSKKLTAEQRNAALQAAPCNLDVLTIDRMATGDFLGRVGVPDYVIRNNGAEIRRCKKRIAEMETRAKQATPAPETIGTVEVFEDTDENRVKLRFPGKPSESIRQALHGSGFHWSRNDGVWKRMASNQAWYWAREIARMTVEATP